MNAVDKVSPIKKKGKTKLSGMVCGNWFKKFNKSKLPIDKNIYNSARYILKKIIIHKKRAFFERKLGKPLALSLSEKQMGHFTDNTKMQSVNYHQ